MKRLAFFAYHFPPMGGGFSQRSAKYAKYLPSFGWQPVVFTAEISRSFPLDRDMLSSLTDDLEIHRLPDYYTSPLRAVAQTLHLEVPFRYANRLLFWPDIHRRWANRARDRFMALDRQSPFDAVFTTSAPWSTHVAGLALKRRTGVPWVADFRDPWTQNYEYRQPLKSMRPWDRRIEAEVYRQADVVVLNTLGNYEALLRDFDVDPGRCVVLPNGYDDEDFAGVRVEPWRDGQIHLLYLGGLRGDWFEGPFYQALAVLRERAPDLGERLQVDFVGVERPVGAVFDSADGARSCVFHGFRPQSEVPSWLAKSHATLLLLPPSELPLGWVPQKFFLYLRAGKPVFAACPGGSVKTIGEATCGVTIAQPGDPEAMACALITFVRDLEAGRLHGPDLEKVSCYEKKTLTRLLAERLDRITRKA